MYKNSCFIRGWITVHYLGAKNSDLQDVVIHLSYSYLFLMHHYIEKIWMSSFTSVTPMLLRHSVSVKTFRLLPGYKWGHAYIRKCCPIGRFFIQLFWRCQSCQIFVYPFPESIHSHSFLRVWDVLHTDGEVEVRQIQWYQGQRNQTSMEGEHGGLGFLLWFPHGNGCGYV